MLSWVEQKRSTVVEVHPIFLMLQCPPLSYSAELNGDKNINTTDATRISHVYVRIMPNNVEHKLLT